VTINPAVPPTITQAPLSRLVYPAGNASFTVAADGTMPISYQWQHAGTNLPGATLANLRLTNVDATMTGNYTVTLTNVAGTTVSSPATLTIRTPSANSYEAAVVGYGPLAYWRFGEPSGATVAFDYAGGYDGFYTDVVLAATGAIIGDPNTAATFDGTSSTVSIGNPAGLNFTGQITLTVWVKPTATDGLRDILAHGYQTSPNDAEVGLRVNAGDYETWSWDGNNHLAGTTIPPQDIGAWVHLAGTYDGTTWRLYRNGIQVASTADTTGSLIVSSQGWAIGSAGDGTERFFSGNIDEPAIFNKALTPDQIQELYLLGAYGYNLTAPLITVQPASTAVIAGSTATLFTVVALGSPPLSYQWLHAGAPIAGATTMSLTLSNLYYTDAGSYDVVVTNNVGMTQSAAVTLTVQPPPTFANLTNGLVMHLTFDTTNSTGQFPDTSGNGNDGYPGGSPTLVPGRIGPYAVSLKTDTANYIYNCVIVYPSSTLVFDTNDSFSVSFWVKYTGLPNDLPMIGNSINSTYQLGWVFTDDTGKIECSLVSTANSGTYVKDPLPGSPVTDNGQWHNVVGIVDREQQVASVYVDGTLAGSWSIVGLGSLDYGNDITLGQDPTFSYGVNGAYTIDDVGIWNRALTSYEAVSIYGAGQNNQSFDVYGPVKAYVNHVGTNIGVSWQAGTLLQSTNVAGPYKAVTGATPPFYQATPTGSSMFFRIQQ